MYKRYINYIIIIILPLLLHFFCAVPVKLVFVLANIKKEKTNLANFSHFQLIDRVVV